ncbi:Holliday junction resolvase RecU [Mammaliicoccus sciuri]|uniref:Holliday junction resolvase RecU n=1 Tax=Mammaliicoccus sciuri TaxID=1296 RepID=UPI001FB2ADE9|nr:Holliday junction resolvase RecU [Mammaliicoccus sciuri]MCJ1783105.1 Holliday junction resolvase RecU [Mammaliicoccus sciuri]
MNRRQANRGMWFETVIGNINRVYKHKEIAIIDKVATPISYNTRTGKARYQEKSTVDFVGCNNKGKYIAFDTKEVKIKNLPLKNVSDHQVKYLTDTKRMGAEAFLLVLFRFNDTCFKLDIDQFNDFKKQHERKSIPYEWFNENAELVRSGNGVIFDYLTDVDHIEN